MPAKDLPKWKQELFKRRLESEPEYKPGEFESDFDKYLQYSERLLNDQCLMCGGSVGEKHEVVGPEDEEQVYMAEAPLCPACLSKPIPPILEEFAEQWDVDIKPEHVGPEFYEETMDPKEIEEKYRSVGEEELRERSGPVSMETIRKIEPKTTPGRMEDIYRMHEEMGWKPPPPKEEVGGWMEGIEEGKKYSPVEASAIKELVKIANELDKRGLYEESDVIDEIIKMVCK